MRKLRWSIPFLLYLVLFVASFYPQSVQPWDTVAYIGDSLEVVWLIAWNVHQFFRDPTRIFEANILYPNPRSLSYTDHRILPSIAVAPVIWLTDNPVLAYNVALALGCLLAAVTGRRLARTLGVDPIGAWAAGALYAFHTYQVNEGPRLHVIFHGFLPLALEQVITFFKTGRARSAFAAAGLMLLQGLSSSYHLLYGALLLGLVSLAALMARPATIVRRVPVLLLAAGIAAVVFLPILVPYVTSAAEHGFHRPLPTGVDLKHYVSTSPTNLLYGPIGAEVRLVSGAAHFVGFFSLALASLALIAWASRRGPEPPDSLLPSRVWVPAAAALALFFVALSLGKDMMVFGHYLGPGPYRLLYNWVPGFQLVRTPERLAVLAMLFVALLVGRGLTILTARGLQVLAITLAVIVPMEHLSPLLRTLQVPVRDQIPAVYQWLARNPVQALAEVPTPPQVILRFESLGMYFSSYHFKPTIHGFESFPPLLTGLLRTLATEFPSEASLQAFQQIGVDTVVVHRGRPEGTELYRRLKKASKADRIRLEARFAGPQARAFEGTADEVYRLVPTTSVPAAPFPNGHRALDPKWHYRATAGEPQLAADGDMSTAWVIPRGLKDDDLYEITFGRTLKVSGLVLRLRRDSRFPNGFKIAGRTPTNRPISLAWFDKAHKLQLLDRLLVDPPKSSIGFNLGERELTSLRIMVQRGGTNYFTGWSIPEIEVWVNDDERQVR